LENVDIRLQGKEKTLKYRNGFWRGAARTSKLLKVINESNEKRKCL
jgi:hypothetical protein